MLLPTLRKDIRLKRKYRTELAQHDVILIPVTIIENILVCNVDKRSTDDSQMGGTTL